jgi:NAD-dependent protein deacetylase sirtuin 6
MSEAKVVVPVAASRDDDAAVRSKAKWLARILKELENPTMVVYTGAGISTAASVPDFRGPGGVWTLQEVGKLPESVSMEQALPTLAHMALVGMLRRDSGGDNDHDGNGKHHTKWLRCVVSQNVDGLHRRSGVPADQLFELHGNCFLERCTQCAFEHERSFDVCEHHGNQAATADFHDTGRRCDRGDCRGPLRNTIVNFGESLPETPLEQAWEATAAADVALVLGTSLTVSPACDMPLSVAERGGKLVICNLEHTTEHAESLADLRVRARTDDFLAHLMRELGEDIPVFDEDAFKAAVRDDVYGIEVIVGHEIDPDGERLRVFVSSASIKSDTGQPWNGEDVVYHVEFSAPGSPVVDVTRAPFHYSVAGTEQSVTVRVFLLNQSLAPIEVDVAVHETPSQRTIIR